MLSPADAPLAARDSVLPGLAVLLDPDAMRDALFRALPAWSLRSLETSYLRYKPGTSCLAAYREERGEVALYATAYRRGAADKLGKAARVLEDLAVAVHRFPDDRRLHRLRRLTEPDGRAREMSRLLPDRLDLESASLATLRYKPERRYVASIALEGAAPAAVIRHYAEGEFPAARRGSRSFCSVGPLRVARRIGESVRRTTLVLEWLSGDDLCATASRITFESLGEALALFHAQEPRGVPLRTGRVERDMVVAATAALAAIDPESARPARELAQGLAIRLGDLRPEVTAIHGDLSLDQFLVRSDGFALLDLDEAAVGDPSADLGSFLADLETKIPPDDIAAIGDAVLAGYERQSGRRPENVALYTAARLLRLATEPFRRRDPDWLERGRRAVERARAIIAGTRRERPLRRKVALFDESMPFLREALDRSVAERKLRQALPAQYGGLRVRDARVVRHKPGRRCLIEYDVETGGTGETIIGKVRARGLDETTFRVMQSLWDAKGPVPEPLGRVPDLRMWLQRKAPGRPATDLLSGPRGPAVAGRTAEALAGLHATRVPTVRRHTVADELAILRTRLHRLANERPEWSARLSRLLRTCESLAEDLTAGSPRGIHRDFYADHVVVDGGYLCLVDFDLYCDGDPALDAGNFLAHVREQSVRTLASPDALLDVERAFEDRYVAIAGEDVRRRIEIYQAFSLARHISLSWEMPQRRAFTEALLDISEERLFAFCRARRR